MLTLSESRNLKSILLGGVLLFGLVSYGLLATDVHDDTLLVFGVAPAASCVFAVLGWMRLRTVLITGLVLIAIWLARYFLLDLSPPALFLFGLVYYAAIAVTLVAVKLYDSVVNSRDAKMPAKPK